MSTSYSERVPFSFELGMGHELPEPLKNLMVCDENWETADHVELTLRGWKRDVGYDRLMVKYPSFDGDLVVCLCKKNEHNTVYLSDPDEDGNEAYVFSEDIGSLHEFARDFGLDIKKMSQNSKVYQHKL